jgi:hypothetical protein
MMHRLRFERSARLGAHLLCASLLVLGCDAADMTKGGGASAKDAAPSDAAVYVPVPVIDSPWRELASNPDLGSLNSPEQETADFAI